MIYLDYCANTPCDESVLKTYLQTERTFFGNPNAGHIAGQAARERLSEAARSAGASLGIADDEIIWTSGASEANNLAIKGIARAQRHRGRHIITTPLEHPSVSGPLTHLQEQGYEIDLLEIERSGKISLEHLKELIRQDTVLVAVSAVDSELGVVQPVGEIAQITASYPNSRLHVDATQAIGKTAFSFAGIDTASLAAHKFYGPNGVGLLYKRRDLVIEPLIHGGAGATVYRSGTPTLALAAALAAALEQSIGNLESRCARVRRLNDRLRSALSGYPAVRINSPADSVPHILNLSVAGVRGTQFQRSLSERGVCVSVKSACSVEGTPSRAVFAVSRDRKNALSSWRISLSHLTTDEEITRFLELFEACLGELTS